MSRRAFQVLALGAFSLIWHYLALPAESGDSQSPEAAKHGSFLPIRDAQPPDFGASDRKQSPLDAFVFQRLQAKGLRPAKPASAHELIRRAAYDLTGLPPTPEEIAAFVRDSQTNADTAYAALIDRLLASPHYGERWGQLWLDVIRFAETEGFEYDRHLPDGWRFRDYVIRSFNNDNPFDLFLKEQLAGDEIRPGYEDAQIAAGFHRLGAVRRNAGNPDIALSRNEVLTERTDIVGSAFLGLTVGCARCHDHKLDPILQKDYYRLQAYLAATHEHNILLVPKTEQLAWEKETARIKKEVARLKKQAANAEENAGEELKAEIAALQKQTPAQPPTITSIRNDPEKRTPIHVLTRGVWELKGEPVGMRPPSILTPAAKEELPADSPQPRTRLADWLTSSSNPLTARVIVNRVWQHHFGVGIVKSANDFGRHGDRPSHPELLDFLASRLVNNGWRLKALHRFIMLSHAYRQSSHVPPTEMATKLDPENRLLWKFNRRRLTAEEIRDTMLHVSGRLNPEAGGASVMLPVDEELIKLSYKPEQWRISRDPADQHRRSVYLIAKRNLRLPFMEVFDQPTMLSSCARRESGTHAPQALELLNGKTANRLAAALAVRLQRDAGSNASAQVERAYLLATGRPPTSAEAKLATDFLKDQSLKEFALAMFNLNAFLYVN